MFRTAAMGVKNGEAASFSLRLSAVVPCILGLTFLLPLLSGCGAGAQQTPTVLSPAAGSQFPTGRLELVIKFPPLERKRGIGIPIGTSVVVVTVTDPSSGATLAPSQKVPRPPTGDTVTVSFPQIRVGPVTLTATAYADVGATEALASGATTGAIQANSVAAFYLPLTLQPVDHVAVSPSALTLTPGSSSGSGTVNARVQTAANGDLPGFPVAWTSSAPGVATVTAGSPGTASVQAVAAGTATITATEPNSGKTGTVLVTVKPAQAVVSVVKVTPATLSFTLGSGSSSASVTAAAYDASNAPVPGVAFTWTSSSAAVASVTAGSSGTATIQAVAAGTATITATEASTGKSGSVIVTVSAGGGSSSGAMAALRPLPGYQGAAALGVNDAGTAVGWSYRPNTYVKEATLWQSRAPQDIGPSNGLSNQATGINGSGQVAGFMSTPGGVRAFIWVNGQRTDLGQLGGVDTYATAINDYGQVAGYTQSSAGKQPFLWTPSAPNGLTGSFSHIPLNGASGIARAIDRSGRVAGGTDSLLAFLWTPSVTNGSSGTTRMDFGDLGGHDPDAWGASSFGVVGFCDVNFHPHAFLWKQGPSGAGAGTTMDLGTLSGAESQAFAINDAGEVAGWSTPLHPTSSLSLHAFLWIPTAGGTSGTMHDLGTLGGDTSRANAISSSGVIAGYSTDQYGNQEGFVWTPTQTRSFRQRPGR